MKKVLSGLFGLALLLGGAAIGRACTTDADCDDGNACNGAEFCQAGVCFNRPPLVCNDGDPCTIDGCDPATGCTTMPAGGCMLSGQLLKLGSRSTLNLHIQTGGEVIDGAFPAQGSSNDPVLHGASIRVSSTAGGFDNTYGLPSLHWAYVGSGKSFGYFYKDLKGASGPIHQMVVHAARSTKVKGRGSALNFTLGADPYPVDVHIQYGEGLIECLSYGGLKKFVPDVQYYARMASAPSTCP